MEYGLFDVLTLIGSLGFFIYGMKIMSDGIQLAAGERLRQILGAMTQNRYFGVATGFLITAIVQSSSATTVMTVSFVNAGLLTLVESAGVMMGANIGTTVTAWILSELGFKVSIAAVSLPLIAFGLPMFVSGKNKIKYWGQFIIGFALLFMGIEELKNSVPDVNPNPEILEFLSNYTDKGILSTVLFVIAGTVLTIVLQSSSATMALTLVMTYNGWIPFPAAAAMVLGENIGTTITAELASLVGNVHAKRSARIHSSFNIIGVTWMVIILPWYLELVELITIRMEGASPYESTQVIPTALAIFHTMFNATNVLLLIAFVPQLVKLAIRLVPSKGEEDEQFHLEYIANSELVNTPELALEEVRKELTKFSTLIIRMKTVTFDLIFENNDARRKKLLARLENLEESSDHFEEEIDKFLVKIAEGKLSEKSSGLLKSYISITSGLESAGDVIYRMVKDIRRGYKVGLELSTSQKKGLESIMSILNEALVTMDKNLNADYKKVLIAEARQINEEIQNMEKQLWKDQIKKIEHGKFKVKSGIVYRDLFAMGARLGAQVFEITEFIVENSKEEKKEEMEKEG
jgi:phosphate:Na+ symporter